MVLWTKKLHIFISDLYESSEEIPVLEYFWKNSRSIEIMKDGELQKIHFRVKDEVSNSISYFKKNSILSVVLNINHHVSDWHQREHWIKLFYLFKPLRFVLVSFLLLQGVLREEVKEMVKWNVDRSSSSTKIRELMDWSKDIVEDIYYQLEIRKNIFADFLIKHW